MYRSNRLIVFIVNFEEGYIYTLLKTIFKAIFPILFYIKKG